MSIENDSFAPAWGTNQNVTPGASSARVQLNTSPAIKGRRQLCITQNAAVKTFVKAGDSSVEASAADYVIPAVAGLQFTITIPANADYVAYIAPAGGCDIDIMLGSGI